MASQSPSILSAFKAGRVRFTEEDDLVLLREILANNPYTDSSKWAVIQGNMEQATGKNISCRGMKEHVHYIIKKFEKKEKTNRALSGVEEPYNELDHLLQEVLDLNGAILKEKEKIKKQQQSAEKGKIFRDDISKTLLCEVEPAWVNKDETAVANNINTIIEDHCYLSTTPTSSNNLYVDFVLNEHNGEQNQLAISNESNEMPKESQSNIKGPSRKRKSRTATNILKKNTLQYLNEKNNAKQSIRMKELAIEEQKLKLEKEKFLFEKERFEFSKLETMRRLNIEEEKTKVEIAERKAILQMVENQQFLLKKLLTKYSADREEN